MARWINYNVDGVFFTYEVLKSCYLSIPIRKIVLILSNVMSGSSFSIIPSGPIRGQFKVATKITGIL